MTRSAENAPPLAPGLPAWQRCLGPGAEDNPLYHEAFNGTRCTILRSAPRRILELGCAGDVLEHMVDPWHALVRILPLLSPDAQVAVSVPNVRNLRVHAQLHNQGSWRYDTHGLLDITHLRFFAMQDAVRMLDETGYAVQDVKGTVDPELAELFRANAGKSAVSVQAGRLRLDNLTLAELQEYCTLQWVLLATPKPAAANDPLAA
jgi:hypothetical protein